MPKMHGFTPDYNKNIGEADEQLNDDGIAPLAKWSRDEPVHCAVFIHRTPGVEDKPDYRVSIECDSDDVEIEPEWFSTRTDARSRCFDFMTNTSKDKHAEYTPDTQSTIPDHDENATGLDAIACNLNMEKLVKQFNDVKEAGVNMDDEISVRKEAFEQGHHMLCLALDRTEPGEEETLYRQLHDVLTDDEPEPAAAD